MMIPMVALFLVFLTEIWGQTIGPGTWELLVENGGVSAMHMTTTHQNTVVMFDRTDYGPSELRLDGGRCRDDPRDLALTHDCWAHSIEYTIRTNKVRPLMVKTDTWCSSGAFVANGSLIHTGGFNDGANAIRHFDPCADSACDWHESESSLLSDKRWYASDQILPDDRVIVVGGRRSFSYEFVPKKAGEGSYRLPFLAKTSTANAENNLYPFLHLSSDGNIFIFANRDSILFDYKNDRVAKTFPRMPGGPRNYPSSGSSVMLPLSAADGFSRIEILICGGAPDEGYQSAVAGKLLKALDDCGRMVITDPNAEWAMESMPAPRIMGDMLILPNAQILIINGAEDGTAGWELATVPALAPYLYTPNALEGQRFSILGASSIPRMYHSSTNVLPDGRILVGGSNPHVGYVTSGVAFPTELRLEAYSPYYLDNSYSNFRPAIAYVSSSRVEYGSRFSVRFEVKDFNATNFQLNVYAPPFTTHTFSMNQRMLSLATTPPKRVMGTYVTIVTAPPSAVAAPPGYYMLFLVNNAIPSVAQWVQFS